MGIANMDEAADDGDARVSVPDEGTDQVLTVGEQEVVNSHLGEAEEAMIRDLEHDVQKQLPIELDSDEQAVTIEGRGENPADDSVDSEERWRRQLVLYENDLELYEQAKANGFRGKWTEVLWRELSKYAIGVLQEMVYSEKIYGIVAKKKRPVDPAPTDREKELLVLVKREREELAYNVVADAFVLWMTYEANGTGYDPSHGKSLPSYLVELCKYTFSSGFRDWRRSWGWEAAASTLGLDGDQIAEKQGVHDYRAQLDRNTTAEWCDKALDGVWSRLKNDREKTIFGMRLAGIPVKDIAEELGITPKAVSRAWERITQRERNRG